MVKSNTSSAACCGPRQKVYGIIALVGLFACGLMVGIAMNGNRSGNAMMEKQCNALSKQIVRISSRASMDADDLAMLEKLNATYAKNCAGYNFTEEPKIAPKHEDMVDKKTCEVIEELLQSDLFGEQNSNPQDHRNNIETYKKLAVRGCPENAEKYQALIVREQEILAALTGGSMSGNNQTCLEIEELLNEQLPVCTNAFDSVCHIERAKIYANMSERGCAENKQQYVNLAAKELEIARALQDDKFNDFDKAEISDTYRRIQMKQTANEILNKVQQLADPAIDFIIQAQKIIEE